MMLTIIIVIYSTCMMLTIIMNNIYHNMSLMFDYLHFISLQSRSIDKRHAVLNFDVMEEKFKVKDLGSLNGVCLLLKKITYTNITIKQSHTIR